MGQSAAQPASPIVWAKGVAANAVVGGDPVQGKAQHFCRMKMPDGLLHPAMEWNGACYGTFGGKMAKQHAAETLVVNAQTAWAPVTGGKVPTNALVAFQVGGVPMHFCRAASPDKIVRAGKEWKGTCYVAFDNKELKAAQYSVLTVGGGSAATTSPQGATQATTATTPVTTLPAPPAPAQKRTVGWLPTTENTSIPAYINGKNVTISVRDWVKSWSKADGTGALKDTDNIDTPIAWKDSGATVLGMAAKFCDLQVVRWLIRDNADAQFVDSWKVTPLHYAKPMNCTAQTTADDITTLTNYLLDNGADVNAVDKWGKTPLANTPIKPSPRDPLMIAYINALLAKGATR